MDIPKIWIILLDWLLKWMKKRKTIRLETAVFQEFYSFFKVNWTEQDNQKWVNEWRSIFDLVSNWRCDTFCTNQMITFPRKIQAIYKQYHRSITRQRPFIIVILINVRTNRQIIQFGRSLISLSNDLAFRRMCYMNAKLPLSFVSIKRWQHHFKIFIPHFNSSRVECGSSQWKWNILHSVFYPFNFVQPEFNQALYKQLAFCCTIIISPMYIGNVQRTNVLQLHFKMCDTLMGLLTLQQFFCLC